MLVESFKYFVIAVKVPFIKLCILGHKIVIIAFGHVTEKAD